jgi:hypothetical protein
MDPMQKPDVGKSVTVREMRAEIARLRERQAWIDAVPPKDHPDDERGWCAAYLSATHDNKDLLARADEADRACNRNAERATEYQARADKAEAERDEESNRHKWTVHVLAQSRLHVSECEAQLALRDKALEKADRMADEIAYQEEFQCDDWGPMTSYSEYCKARAAVGEQDGKCKHCGGSGCVACDARVAPHGGR